MSNNLATDHNAIIALSAARPVFCA